ncbi:anthranilate synthase component II [Microvirga pudoricolor]|uniref:anthranilate synthase component II n=1 Tax=Microvirga pudoricolor TaxID=2778729 RepID=UPI0019513A46|nr:aminodeoxychorismate/anthranilate synthase component II [Microvirga pudoricolor]MBM6595751.1 aminodeoxychorismate/anthranilate synthase component II [Microvirga pudoricolor]
MTRVLVIDNYDSFTWNLVHLIAPLASSMDVVRNDATSVDEVLASRPDAIVLSPGPRTPNEAGICLDLVTRASPEIPTFGVCLGLQTIGQVFGGTVARAPLPMHGKVSPISHGGQTIFRGINGPINATRYHSLIVERETCPVDLSVTAETDDGLIMGLSHRFLPIHGVQFHPESILSEHGSTIMKNFFDLAAAWNAGHRPDAPPSERDKTSPPVH